MKHIVLDLTADWLVKIESLANGKGLINLLWIPVAGAPIKGFPSFNDFIKSSTNFLKRSFRIKSVSKHNINILQLKSLEALVNALMKVLAISVGGGVYIAVFAGP